MSDWQKRGLVALVAVLALVGAFVGGRFSAPRQVQTIDTVRVQFQDREVVKTVTVEKVVEAQAKVVYRDRIIKGDTIVEHEVERVETKIDDTKTTEGVKVSDRTGSSDTSHVQTVTLQPKWRVSLDAGASWLKPLVPIAGPLVLGLHADYRIVGGLSAGLWINTFGAAGLGLSFEF